VGVRCQASAARIPSSGLPRSPRLLLLLLLGVLALADLGVLSAPAAARRFTAANWDLAAQRAVVSAGVMSDEGSAGFAGAGDMSAEAESSALTVIAESEDSEDSEGSGPPAVSASAPVAVQAGAPITVVRFDALLVDQLGLGEVAEHVQQVAAGAGLDPPSYFGSEVVARYLGLRYEHPTGEQALDLYPWNMITRAEAAYSFAQALEAGGRSLSGAREALSSFALPHYTGSQLQVLRIAVSKIGMPYVWGGTTDNTADGLEHGGYDCSGFVWRVYKVSGLPWGRQILGRTAAEQAGEIPKSARIHLEDVQPGDLLFFGSAPFGSKATESNVIHEGIALSGQWAIHSSGQGVYVLPLTTGWLAQSFTWARRVL
jgi:cell wall-associated NlpC family hydrolase